MNLFRLLVGISLLGQIILLTTKTTHMIRKTICIVTTSTLLWLCFTDALLGLPALFALIGSLLCMFKTTIGECWRVIGWYSVVIFTLFLLF